ncbi:dihydrolipoyllysine-residue acetyltransferase [Rhodocyclus purpureus]|uniref:dihydrolipoyllysine-residue acetyltransferase n=1 Tax=Rhodocyclus purpureus TaxID=1067 RepID=UPI0019147B53|nr:dihydrolipoyllysine-residue acetyltransferase [Rhodocyclus purpureus]MBK5915762.1 branched-chain alpha-keto acid dehydrogenase subunit E2 [Rhodocyclus purpureus]
MSEIIEVKVPDIGAFADVPVIDLFVKVGDAIKIDDPIVTLESDKATVDVPSSVTGVVSEVLVRVGSRVGEGVVLIKVASEPVAGAASAANIPGSEAGRSVPSAGQPAVAPPATPAPVGAASVAKAALAAAAPSVQDRAAGAGIHASPSVRAYARELGADLSLVTPSGPKGRILREDLTRYVKGVMSGALSCPGGGVSGGGVLELLPWPKVDFARFGEIEVKPLPRIRRISAQNLARNAVMIPAVTYHEDADISELEAFRVRINQENAASGVKLTLLAFLIKAVVKALQKHPEFNASLTSDENGEMSLVLKKYFHIGFAADTPHGLMVPVIRDADRKSVVELAQEAAELARQARDGKLAPAAMQGACFTISSVGGIGGTGFSPIINAPEVAILGVNKAATKPVWDGKSFVPRLMLPLSLSADHRVIDGALATRFNVFLADLLADFRRVSL